MKILEIKILGDFESSITHLYAGGISSPHPNEVLEELLSHMELPVVVDGVQMNCRNSSEQRELFKRFESILRGHGYAEYKPATVFIGD